MKATTNDIAVLIILAALAWWSITEFRKRADKIGFPAFGTKLVVAAIA